MIFESVHQFLECVISGQLAIIRCCLTIIAFGQFEVSISCFCL